MRHAADPNAQPGQDFALLEEQIQAINRFPDQNPNPVMRISDDGYLTYANTASQPVCRAIGGVVGDRLPDEILARLRRAAEMPGDRVEVTENHRTYALLPVPVPDLGFVNVYGTDVTAENVIAKFPDQNPHPVLRLDRQGMLRYANRASRHIVNTLGLRVGDPVPGGLRSEVLGRLSNPDRGPIEVLAADLTYELLPVEVPEFEFINLYGTDVTAARQLARAKDETERLLLNILPPPIADRLRAGERVIADRFDDASLLIADIVGFTELSSGMTAGALVELLNDIFSVCDALVERHGLEKVKTIGDAYMVVGGVPIESPDHAERLADFALDMAVAVEAMQEGLERQVTFRIGMSCGPVVAGVIGSKRTIYDIWGDTVNLASRMEALSEPGRIHISDAMRDHLSERFRLEPRGFIEVKGKGKLPTWFLLGRN
jgi:class 3 adenylate cyclase